MDIWTRLQEWAAKDSSFRLTKDHRQHRRYIREYQFPVGVRLRFAREHPQLSFSQREEVFRALRQYFTICYNLNGTMAAMPSQIVDDAWHGFILFTREYSDFCRRAFGRYLHHTPAEAMSSPTQATGGIQRTWHVACRIEGVDPAQPTRLPLLFAIDANLNIPDGFIYRLNCTTDAKSGAPNSKRTDYCAVHIGCSGGCGGGAADGGCSDGGSCGGSTCGGSGCGGGCGGD